VSTVLERWDYFELIDDIGQTYYRWDAERSVMEWWCGSEGWCSHGWTPGSLMRYVETYDDATLTVVTEDDVR
jgi:hypothetical protein